MRLHHVLAAATRRPSVVVSSFNRTLDPCVTMRFSEGFPHVDREQLQTRTTLQVGGRSWISTAWPRCSSRIPGSRPPAVLAEDPARESAAPRRRRLVKADDIEALARWDVRGSTQKEMSFAPARVLLQDFTGVPCVVDLAAMRDAVPASWRRSQRVNPLQPVELVIDHSVQVDYFGQANAFQLNAELEFSRNRERYAFLRWGQNAFGNFRVVPPDTGIVHQVNLEYLARVVVSEETPNGVLAYPDTLVGTDSHTTMINGLGVVGWGVGGIEAEAAMLGQPISMLIPPVLGFRLTGAHARRHHGHRPRADDHRTAPQTRRRRQVR